MPLTPQTIPINFAQGLDTKTDPKQVTVGKFLSLENTVFTTGDLLQKRNGYGPLAPLPIPANYLTTFDGNLTAIGSTLQAYSEGTTSWISKGSLVPVELSVMPTVRSALNQVQADSVIAANGLMCTAYTELAGSIAYYKYQIQDSNTGQSIVGPTALAVEYVYSFTVSSANATAGATYTNNGVTFTVESTIASATTLVAYASGIPTASGTLTKVSGTGDSTITFSAAITIIYAPRVFLLGTYFIVAYTSVSGGSYQLDYVAISTNNPAKVTAPATLVSSYIPFVPSSWDGAVANIGTGASPVYQLYLAYNTTSGGQAVDFIYLTQNLAVSSATTFTGSTATNMSICIDATASSPIIYAAFYNVDSSTGFVVAVDQLLSKRMTATEIIASGAVYNITCTAQNGACTSVYEVANQYSYANTVPTNFLDSVTVTLPATVTTGTVGATTLVLRGVGLASKGFILNGNMYVLSEYASQLQSTYFLVNLNGNVISRFAYENGGASLVASNGYLPYNLPQAQVIGGTASIAYLYKDLIETQNTTGLVQSIGPAGASNIYSQTGVNVVFLGFSSNALISAEIGNNLNVTGGLLLAYDGQTINEQGFSLFPDNILATWAATGGAIQAQPDGSTNTNAYYYQIIYEWTDARGNLFRSAPSVPVAVTTTGALSTGIITLDIPYYRITYKQGMVTPPPTTAVKIQIYRWSVGQQVYYQTTSITQPTLNDTTKDFVVYVDTLADASILGNNIIYTTGGVVEDIAGPASVASTLFDDRLWLVDAEDQNLLWFSKQIIEATPVELSDQLTMFVAPTIGAQGSTGTITALAPLDSNLIIFKKDAIYYVNGTGPDNTGANSQYGQPIFITSTVGCANPKSIVITNEGLMFQSDKGIWLLTHGLSVSYVGAPVEKFNSSVVNSAVIIPGATQARFTLNTGQTLMYDYYYQQWGSFTGVSAISSTLYQGLHTYISPYGGVFQETPGKYLDNGNTVLIGGQSGPVWLAGILGYQRVWELMLLGSYYSPHSIVVNLQFDYGASSQQYIINPLNGTGVYGSDSLYGQTTPFGGPPATTPWRIQLDNQRCQTFQFSFQEQYNPTLGQAAGFGFTLSSISCLVGIKKGSRPFSAAQTVGGTQ